MTQSTMSFLVRVSGKGHRREKELAGHNDVFSDIVNGFLFLGRQAADSDEPPPSCHGCSIHRKRVFLIESKHGDIKVGVSILRPTGPVGKKGFAMGMSYQVQRGTVKALRARTVCCSRR